MTSNITDDTASRVEIRSPQGNKDVRGESETHSMRFDHPCATLPFASFLRHAENPRPRLESPRRRKQRRPQASPSAYLPNDPRLPFETPGSTQFRQHQPTQTQRELNSTLPTMKHDQKLSRTAFYLE
ncbi:hypothetical protein [Pelagicoccus sp. SDUM812002]|uniref:hypothetical protein n=1 Tax=Pelagicoccus sp. SDUM812002 TaxID=3041266 RepID=UPI0028105826|nr:hypothetical protein [Pelagicoccus sp. SDUM812002]MDQ8186183.1 hypothetical protein [Pelagicoccus sp. SDUM812002]